MVVFGDKNTGQYVETEYADPDNSVVSNRRAIIKWNNYPAEIIYYHDVVNESHYVTLSNWLHNILHMNDDPKDIFQARRVLDISFHKEDVARSAKEIRELKNKAFDNINTMNEEYWFGVFDALRWVLGDEVEEFDNVSTN